MTPVNIYYLREMYNELYDSDIEHVIEDLKEELKDQPETLKEQLAIVSYYANEGCVGLYDILVTITKEWLEYTAEDERKLYYYNTMCNEKFYDDAFIYTMEDFWKAVEDQGLSAQEAAELSTYQHFDPREPYAMFDGEGNFISSDVAAYLIGDFTDVAEFMVEQDLLDEVK